MLLFFVSLCLAGALAKAPAHDYVRMGRTVEDESLEFRVLMFQNEVEAFHQHVHSLSDPTSPKFAQWMTVAEIQAMLNPSEAVRAKVLSYLQSRSFSLVRDLGDALIMRGSVKDIESTFSARVHTWRHSVSGRVRSIIESDFRMPAELAPHVETLAGITHIPLRSSVGAKRRSSLANHGGMIPHFLRYLYNVSEAEVSSTKASIALIEFEDYSPYTKSGLQAFIKGTADKEFTFDKVVGRSPSGQGGLESLLDAEYGGAMAQGAEKWFWTVDKWVLEFAQDIAVYQNPPTVVSQSWGWTSTAMCGPQGPGGSCGGFDSRQYVARTETEYAKGAARGITFLSASGDQGAPGDEFPGCQPGLGDIYPGTSLFGVSVGATMLGGTAQESAPRAAKTPWNAPVCEVHQCADGSFVNEVVCSHPTALITSGGGAAKFLPMPEWQRSHVEAYLKSGVNLPERQYYNASARFFPDISAMGHAYFVWANADAIEQVDGTSCSTPVFAGLVTLANSKRLAAGKKTLGNIAPAIYKAHSNLFHQITDGNNRATESCVSRQGWEAHGDWSPTCGRGTPRWNKMEEYLVNL